ncbi:hypothetical protein [Streptomyces sp. NBC_00986]|uniref:hypothetical protein n=1 Tax=Streptomyces sp. NBC_00986 TaxID=2903702 RepID=UPI00386BA36F|nr:hypothetical protein OG504_21305 [Streptomyces sp. NBC_00986]
MTTTTKAQSAEGAADIAPPPLPRGRHRRPRPRKVLLAVGGLAVAAGVLSLVRLAPESGVGGLGTAEAEPRPDPGTGATDGTDRPANAAATISADPTAIPSATSVMGGITPSPTTTSGVVPTPYATATPPAAADADPTTVPETTTATTPPPQAPAPRPTSTPTPTPTPTPSRTANSPVPAPSRPSLCVPIIGLCVDGLANH